MAQKRLAARQSKATRHAAQQSEKRSERAGEILRALKRTYRDADCALQHGDPFQLLIATILSAQSTDVAVNKVTPELFRRFPTPRELAAAPQAEVEELIHSTGFYRQKAKNIIGSARELMARFGGAVPATLEELTSLPGVARKTANVVLGTWFERNEGVVVDTHVGRIAHRLGLTWTSRDSKDAIRIEQDLMQLLPRRDWTFFSHAVILHGRAVCTARKPVCEACALRSLCPSALLEALRP